MSKTSGASRQVGRRRPCALALAAPICVSLSSAAFAQDAGDPSTQPGGERAIGVRPANPPAAPCVDLRYRRQWALLIGINKYPNLRPRDQLQFARADVEALRKVLVEEYGYRPDDITVLLDERADRVSILDALYSHADKTRVAEEDSLLIYFSGHGKDVAVPAGRLGFLVPYDAGVDLDNLDNPAPFLKTCISMDELNRTARAIPARHVLFLVDCCYGGLAVEQPREFESNMEIDLPYLRRMLSFSVRQIITAGSAGEQVVEKPDFGHSAFAYKVLEGLGKGRLDTDGDGVILAAELGVFLQKAIPNIPVKQTPQAKVLSGEGGFVFFRGPSAAPTTLAPQPPAPKAQVEPPEPGEPSGTSFWNGLRIRLIVAGAVVVVVVFLLAARVGRRAGHSDARRDAMARLEMVRNAFALGYHLSGRLVSGKDKNLTELRESCTAKAKKNLSSLGLSASDSVLADLDPSSREVCLGQMAKLGSALVKRHGKHAGDLFQLGMSLPLYAAWCKATDDGLVKKESRGPWEAIAKDLAALGVDPYRLRKDLRASSGPGGIVPVLEKHIGGILLRYGITSVREALE